MSESIAHLGATPDSTYGHGQQPKPHAEAADGGAIGPDETDASDPADFRLIIEDDAHDGVLIYKTLDGRTGRVVQALDREQVLKMRGERDYVAGQLIKTRA